MTIIWSLFWARVGPRYCFLQKGATIIWSLFFDRGSEVADKE